MKASVGAGLGLLALGGYAFGIEPAYRLETTRYTLTPKQWHKGVSLKIAVVADIHAGGYNMPMSRVEDIVTETNKLNADIIVYLGDSLAGYRRFGFGKQPDFRDVANALKVLKAPLGVHSVLGNHDWWDDPVAQKNLKGPTIAHKLFGEAGLNVLENDSLKLTKNGKSFYLAGLGDQLAFTRSAARAYGVRRGVDDLRGTLEEIPQGLPIILIAHEPYIFRRMSDRVMLTLSGHTHGGQVNIFGINPAQILEPRNKFIYGHFQSENKHLIVSGGLGCSHIPLRLGRPPEIVEVTLHG